MQRWDFGGGGMFGLVLVALAALVALVVPLCQARLFAKDGGLWFRFGGRIRGLFLAWPIVRVPVIAGGSDGMPAQGSYLLLGSGGDAGSPDNPLEVAEVISISGGGGTTERIDFTHLRSPGRYREFKPSFIDPGVLTVSCQYIPRDPSHIRILALKDSGTEVGLREVFPDADGWDYNGYVASAVKEGQSVGGKILLNWTFQITGAVDFTGGGSPN